MNTATNAAAVVIASETETKLTGAQRKALRSYIDGTLRTNPRAVELAMVRLYALQTADEQVVRETKHHNNVGFNSSSANTGSYLAGLVSRGLRLHPENLERARKIALRHSRQLVDLMIAKMGVDGALALLSK